ncbi:MAG: hypothetical protein LBV69_04865 [Bacteroidales bacterium]|nr:hypothetical protein [Bacteroidales bacterium]
MKRIICTFLIIFFLITITFAQSIILQYEDLNIKHDNWENFKYTFIVLNNKKAVSYYQGGTNYIKIDNFIPVDITMIDKTKYKYKTCIYKIKGLTQEKMFVQFSKWLPIENYFDNFIRQQKEFQQKYLLQDTIDSKITYTKPKFRYLDGKKEILDYKCNQLEMKYYDAIYNVWYTTDINYNWIFPETFNEIQGTIIQIEREDTVVFKLNTVEQFYVSKTIFTNSDLKKILKNW